MKADWVTRSCPLCESTIEARLFAESTINLTELDGFAFASRKLPEYMHPRLMECCGCGILYGNPVLSLDVLAEAYAKAEFDSGGEAHFASATYACELNGVMKKLPNLDGALDIGTGDGAFLEQLLKFGFHNVIGVEPSAAPIESAQREIRPLIRQGLFRRQDFPAESFSLITCFQTMEHVSDPLETSRSAHALLKPGGALAIVVHNRRSLSAKVLGMKSPIFDIEHLQLFCKNTCKIMLERSGFHDIQVRSIWNQYPIHYWMKLLPLPAGMKAALLASLKDSAVGSTPIALPAGNLICTGIK